MQRHMTTEQEPTQRTQPTPPAPSQDASSDARYLLVIGGLMILIIVLLAALWLKERARANRAAESMAAMRNLTSRELGRFLGAQAPGVRPLQRDDLPAETVDWNGRPRKVLLVGPAAGTRLGLQPGDVLVVADAPAPATATAPASRSADGR
jgi:hypothetical protein